MDPLLLDRPATLANPGREGDGVFADRLDAVETGYADLPEIMEIVAFIREGGKRPLCLPVG